MVNQLKTVVLLGGLSAMLVGIGAAIAPGSLTLMIGLALLMNALGAARLPAHVQPATASLFIVNPPAGAGRLVQLFSTHPPMEERVRRLRAMASGRWAA